MVSGIPEVMGVGSSMSLSANFWTAGCPGQALMTAGTCHIRGWGFTAVHSAASSAGS